MEKREIIKNLQEIYNNHGKDKLFSKKSELKLRSLLADYFHKEPQVEKLLLILSQRDKMKVLTNKSAYLIKKSLVSQGYIQNKDHEITFDAFVDFIKIENITVKTLTMKTVIKTTLLSIFGMFCIVMIILYFNYSKNDYYSETLKEYNLKGKVKYVFEENAFLSSTFFSLYDSKGDLEFYTLPSISLGGSRDDNGGIFNLNNYLVIDTNMLPMNTPDFYELTDNKMTKYSHLLSRLNEDNKNKWIEKGISLIKEEQYYETKPFYRGDTVFRYLYHRTGVEFERGMNECYILKKHDNTYIKLKCDTGDTINVINYDPRGEKIFERTASTIWLSRDYTLTFYNDGLPLRKEFYDSNNKKNKQINFEYDNNNNLIKEDEYNSKKQNEDKDSPSVLSFLNSEDPILKSYNYAYDKNGNWISKEIFENYEWVFTERRKIVYYTFWEYLEHLFSMKKY